MILPVPHTPIDQIILGYSISRRSAERKRMVHGAPLASAP